jgi:hypothetical protein
LLQRRVRKLSVPFPSMLHLFAIHM